MRFLPMKIDVKNNLDEIIFELGRLGYKEEYRTNYIPQSIKVLDCGVFQILSIHISEHTSLWSETKTLAELKEM